MTETFFHPIRCHLSRLGHFLMLLTFVVGSAFKFMETVLHSVKSQSRGHIERQVKERWFVRFD